LTLLVELSIVFKGCLFIILNIHLWIFPGQRSLDFPSLVEVSVEAVFLVFLCAYSMIFIVLEISFVIVAPRDEVTLPFGSVLVEVALVKGTILDNVHSVTLSLTFLPLT
jgi:hypothetical protein